MGLQRSMRIRALAGVIAIAITLPALAQIGTPGPLAAPEYGSGVSAGPLSDHDFNTPGSDGRPGVKFFAYGVDAFRRGDYRHAIEMYEVAASWAYKPAEYNLGVMYFKGEGVPVDRARGAAWMILAAERGDPQYAKARDLMITVLSDTEFQRTDAIWNELKGTYGDAVALRRAKVQWQWAKTHQTGTRVGGATGELAVGVLDGGHTPKSVGRDGRSSSVATNGFMLLQSGAVDGSVAYRQFDQSDNPYDPVFLKNRKGIVTLEPLQPIEPGSQPSRGKPVEPADANPQGK